MSLMKYVLTPNELTASMVKKVPSGYGNWKLLTVPKSPWTTQQALISPIQIRMATRCLVARSVSPGMLPPEFIVCRPSKPAALTVSTMSWGMWWCTRRPTSLPAMRLSPVPTTRLSLVMQKPKTTPACFGQRLAMARSMMQQHSTQLIHLAPMMWQVVASSSR